MSQSYLIHDNGGRPYRVQIEGKYVLVYKQGTWAHDQTKTDETVIMEFKGCQKIFIGKDTSDNQADGNTILLQPDETKNVYFLISRNIYKFETVEPVLDFFSPIGNSDVPYEFAVTKNWLYLTTAKVRITRRAEYEAEPYMAHYKHMPANIPETIPMEYVDLFEMPG